MLFSAPQCVQIIIYEALVERVKLNNLQYACYVQLFIFILIISYFMEIFYS